MPGLLRAVGRTAVVAGTASAVSGRVQRRQADKFAERDAHAAAQRSEAYAQETGAAPAYAPPPHAVRGSPAAGLRRPAPAAVRAPAGGTGGALPGRRDQPAQAARRAARRRHPDRGRVRGPEGQAPWLIRDDTRTWGRAASPPAARAAAGRRAPEPHGPVVPGAVGESAPAGACRRDGRGGRRRGPRRPARAGAAPARPRGDRRRLAGPGPGRRPGDRGHHRPGLPRPGAHHHRAPGAPCPRPAPRPRLARRGGRGALGLPAPDLRLAGPGRLRRPPRRAVAAVQGRVREVHRRGHDVAVVARRHHGPGGLDRQVDRPEQPGRPSSAARSTPCSPCCPASSSSSRSP